MAHEDLVVPKLTDELASPHLLSEAELADRMTSVMSGVRPEILTIAEQLSQMALEARINSESARGKRNRRLLQWGSWSYGSLSAVVSAAVGGTVLALSQLPGWVRYVVAGVALAAAALGALNPGLYYSEDRRRNFMYWSFHRWTWQYILVELPTADLTNALARLTERSTAFDAIRGVPSPVWDSARPESGSVAGPHGNPELATPTPTMPTA
jgi:hypothetical protein